jgi:glycosyltransferase involved in cell wall biosynthesis
MKVCILSVQVPFMTGGAEVHAMSLKDELTKRGCQAEIVLIPFKWYPPARLLDCMLMARLIDVEEVNGSKIDRVIGLKFPAYYAPHPHKVCWILHQHRQAYDLYGGPYSDLWQSETGRRMAVEIKRWDDYFIPQSASIFANSKTVAARLLRFNGIKSTPLYHPPAGYTNLRAGRFDSYIFYPGRFDQMKRQHLIFDAIAQLPSEPHLVLCGPNDSPYGRELVARIQSSPNASRVRILGPISEAEKLDLYANCLAVYNGVVGEDYGYVTLEAFFSGKPVVTHHDSGGPLEFVVDGHNGYITRPDPASLADVIDSLAKDSAKAEALGRNGRDTIRALDISWDHVVDNLLSS